MLVMNPEGERSFLQSRFTLGASAGLQRDPSDELPLQEPMRACGPRFSRGRVPMAYSPDFC
jgi:hypothetical protein